MKRSSTQDRRTGRRALALAAVATAAAFTAMPVSSASAQSPVIIGPLLQIFTFGADVGIPTGCQAGTATAGSISAEANLATQAAPAIAAVNGGCDTTQKQADTYIAMGNKQSAPLAVLNPTVNPMIGQAATSSNQFAAQYGSALAPFGGTLAGLGATLNFFQGK